MKGKGYLFVPKEKQGMQAEPVNTFVKVKAKYQEGDIIKIVEDFKRNFSLQVDIENLANEDEDMSVAEYSYENTSDEDNRFVFCLSKAQVKTGIYKGYEYCHPFLKGKIIKPKGERLKIVGKIFDVECVEIREIGLSYFRYYVEVKDLIPV